MQSQKTSNQMDTVEFTPPGNVGTCNWDGALEVEIPVNYHGTRCRCLMSPARDQLSKVRRSYTEYGIEPPILTFFSKQTTLVLQKVET